MRCHVPSRSFFHRTPAGSAGTGLAGLGLDNGAGATVFTAADAPSSAAWHRQLEEQYSDCELLDESPSIARFSRRRR